MRVVLDASVAVAALIRPRGWTAAQLARSDVEWYIPTFLLDELEDHLREFAGMADVSPSTLRLRIESLRSKRMVTDERMKPHHDDPIVRQAATIDPDDAPYLAAVLAVRADYLWTRDKELFAAFPTLAVRVVPLSAP